MQVPRRFAVAIGLGSVLALALSLWLLLGVGGGAELRAPVRAEVSGQQDSLLAGERVSEVARVEVPGDGDSPEVELLGGEILLREYRFGGDAGRLAGTISFRRLDGESVRGPEISGVIRAGLWEARLDPGSLYRVEGVHVRGLRAELVDAELVISRDQRRVEIALATRAVLRVVDAETGLDLAGVDIVIPGSWAEVGLEVPVLDEFTDYVVENRASPIRLPDAVEAFSYWVGAMGYQWKSVVYGLHDEVLEVVLHRAGSLRVGVPFALEGRPNRLGLLLQKVGPDGSEMAVAEAVMPASAGSILWTGLEEGVYRVRYGNAVGWHAIRNGRAVSEGLIDWAGCAETKVVAGEEARVDFGEAMPWKERAAGVNVDLEFPQSVGEIPERQVQLVLVRLDSGAGCAPVPIRLRSSSVRFFADGPGHQKWPIRGLAAGRYELTVEPFGLQRTIDLKEAVAEQAHFEVGTLGSVVVHVRVRGTDLTPAGGYLSWMPVPSANSGATGASPRGARRTAQGWELTANEGVVECAFFSNALELGKAEFAVVPGRQEYVLEVVELPLAHVQVKATADGIPAKLPLEWFSAVRASAGPERSVTCGVEPSSEPSASTFGFSFAKDAASLVVPAWGEVRLTFPEVEGYRPIADVKVILERGDRLTVDLKLFPVEATALPH